MVARHSLELLYGALSRVVDGKEKSLRQMLIAYRKFAISNNSLFLYTQNTSYWLSPKTKEASVSVVRLLDSEIDGNETEKIHKIRLLRSYASGFVMLELQDGFGIDVDVETSFLFGLDAVLEAIEER